jgi:hypothetical protein
MNEKFEKLVFKNCDAATAESTLALVVLFGLSAFLLYWGIKVPFFPILLMGVGVGVGGYYTYKKFQGEFKGAPFWVKMIKENPDNIVWIKPIVTKHTVGIVITLYKERKFQFLTADGLKITMKCDSDEDQKVFFEGVNQYLYNAHIGYSLDVDNIYRQDSVSFIRNLKKNGLYTPITSYKI